MLVPDLTLDTEENVQHFYSVGLTFTALRQEKKWHIWQKWKRTAGPLCRHLTSNTEADASMDLVFKYCYPGSI